MAHHPNTMSRADFVDAVDHVIRERKTAKVMADPLTCPELSEEQAQQVRTALRECVAVAGWAPFHKAVEARHTQGSQSSPVPWRFYVLEKPTCCAVLGYIREQAGANPDSIWERAMKKKISRLLAGSSALIQVTWLPDADQVSADEPSERTVEHIAAASAAIQNLMLAAEARGMATYWSSGGVLRLPEIFEMLGIPSIERALGSIFFSIDPENYEVGTGGLRDMRGAPSDWTSWVSLG